MIKIDLKKKTNQKKRNNSFNIDKELFIKNNNDNNNESKISIRKSFEIYKNKNKTFKDKLINLNIYSNINRKRNSANNILFLNSYYDSTENPEFLRRYKNITLSDSKSNFTSNLKNKNINNISLLSNNSFTKITQFKNENKININQIKKEKIKSSINPLNKKIISLKKELKYKKCKFLKLKLEIEKKDYENKISKLKEQYNFIYQCYKKKIKSLKIKLIKCEKKYVNIKKLKEDTYNEDLKFQNDKIKILDELIEYRGLLSNFTISNDDNTEEYSKMIKDYSSEEKTIKEGSICEYTKLDSIFNRESLLDERINEDIDSLNKKNKIEIFKYKFLENKI